MTDEQLEAHADDIRYVELIGWDRDPERSCRVLDQARQVLTALEAERAAHQATQAELEAALSNTTITVEAVVDAFKKHDLIPIDETYFNHNQDDEIVCCGLTALAINWSEDPDDFIKDLSAHPFNDKHEALIFGLIQEKHPELSSDQLNSFLSGWDGQTVVDVEGNFYELGRKSWEAVNEETAK